MHIKWSGFTLMLAGLLIAPQVQAANFRLANATFKQGCAVNATIFISTENKVSDAANIIVRYNPADIDIRDANASAPGIQIAPGSTYESYADNVVDTATGTIRLTGFSIMQPYNSGAGSGVFATIPFASRPGVTATTMSIEFRSGDTLDSNIAEYISSDDILTSVQNASFTFEPGPCVADTQAPRVVSTTPANGATGVPLTSDISFRVTDNQSGVDMASVSVDVQGIQYTRDGANRFTYTGTPLDYTINVNPIADFPADTEVSIRVNGKDLDNNVMGQYRFSFNRPPTPPPTPPSCESLGCFSVPQVCPVTPIAPITPPITPTVPAEDRLSISDVELSVLGGALRMPFEPGNTAVLYVNTAYNVVLSRTASNRSVASVRLLARTGEYSMVPGATPGSYQSAVMSSLQTGPFVETVEVMYADGTRDAIPYTLLTIAQPKILGPLAGQPDTVAPVPGAAVEIRQGNRLVESTTTDQFGNWKALVPTGLYTVSANASGIGAAEQQLSSRGIVLVGDIALRQSVGTVLESIVNDTQLTIPEKIPQAARAVVGSAAIALANIGNSEQVQQVVETSVLPAAVIGVGVSAALGAGLAGLANMGALLGFLFTQPLLLLDRRKQKGWGVVYNSLSRLPVAYATVRLINAATNAVIMTRVTDSDGRYFFTVGKGEYRLSVQKNGFVAPSQFAKDTFEDSIFGRIYHGEPIMVDEKGMTITAPIPVDPAQVPLHPTRRVLFTEFMRKTYRVLAMSSVVLSIAAYLVQPQWQTFALVIAQIALYAFFKHLVTRGKPQGFGVVYDAANQKPLASAIVRIFEPTYHKLLETTVTDALGRYTFVVGPNTYQMTAEHAGYETHEWQVDAASGGKKMLITNSIGLHAQAK